MLRLPIRLMPTTSEVSKAEGVEGVCETDGDRNRGSHPAVRWRQW
jgi:hypothetical protein